MRNQINMTITSKFIYKCDEVQGVMPSSNTHRTTDVRMDQLQWYFFLLSYQLDNIHKFPYRFQRIDLIEFLQLAYSFFIVQYAQVQMPYDHIITCISRSSHQRIITIMSIRQHTIINVKNHKTIQNKFRTIVCCSQIQFHYRIMKIQIET